MFSSFQKLGVILTKRDFRKLAFLLACLVISSILEVLGLFSILPFLQVVSKPEMIDSNPWLSWFKTSFGFTSDRDVMVALGIGVLVVYVLTAIVSTVNSWLISRTIWGIAHRICMRLLHRYTQLPYEFFLKQNSAELVKKVISDIHSLVSGILKSSCDFAASALKILVILIFLLIFNPVLALLATAIYGGAYIAIHLARHRYLNQLGEERLDTVSVRLKAFTETLSGIRTLRVSGVTEQFVERFEGASFRFSKIIPKFLLTNLIPKKIIELLAIGGIVGIVLYVLFSDQGLLDIIPTLSVFAIATYKLLPALNMAFVQAANISHNMPVLDVIYEDMSSDEHLLPHVSKFRDAEAIPLTGSLQIEDACYSYEPNSMKVIDALNIEIKQGSSNALVGTTGCGKSTLINIMVGLLFPQSGTVQVDGRTLSRENIFGWQKSIAYVPQNVFLYDDTIAANIALGVPGHEIDIGRVQEAAKLACATEFIENETPQGFQTLIGERGVRLSGGQRQRIGLARAFYQRPKVFFLDEATSALDNVTEEAVMNAIENKLEDVTVVMIAHRLSTVKFCDRIFYIEKGRVVQTGDFESLTSSCPPFRQMVEAGEIGD